MSKCDRCPFRITHRNSDKIRVGEIVTLKVKGLGERGDPYGYHLDIVTIIKNAQWLKTGEEVKVRITTIKATCFLSELAKEEENGEHR